ncbi:MAG TPA: outer membrane protein transport protein, partial [Bacteroidales bacterium]|nr:outer membrane protein transport protein [Bacteroidales bacterium]
MRKVVLLMLSSVFISMSVFAGGYQVRLQGNKQNGFGLVGTSLNWGSSSIFYNPGALSFMKDKIHFAIGASGIMSNAAFQQSGSSYAAETDNPISTPFYVYGAAKINELITVGVGVYTPFGSSVKWKDDWSGKLLIQNISLKAIFIQPTISFNLNEKFGVGAGFSYTTGSVEINKALNYGPNSDVNLNANANGIGFNLGVFYKASDKLSIGLDYRSKISMKVDGGDATFNVPSSLNTLIPATNKFDTELPLPGNLDFGIAYWVTENLLIAF